MAKVKIKLHVRIRLRNPSPEFTLVIDVILPTALCLIFVRPDGSDLLTYIYEAKVI